MAVLGGGHEITIAEKVRASTVYARVFLASIRYTVSDLIGLFRGHMLPLISEDIRPRLSGELSGGRWRGESCGIG